MGIKFSEKDVRPMGRTATGVKAITLREEDYVVSAVKIMENAEILNVTEKGFGKRTETDAFTVQYRGGKGLKVHQLTEKTGALTGVILVEENEEVMLMTSEGIIIRLRARDISTIGRVSQGVKLMNLNDGVTVVGIAKISEEDIKDDELEILDDETSANEESSIISEEETSITE